MPGQHQPPSLNLSARHWHVASVSRWPGLEFRSRKQTGEGSHASSTVRTPDMHGDTALTLGPCPYRQPLADSLWFLISIALAWAMLPVALEGCVLGVLHGSVHSCGFLVSCCRLSSTMWVC